MAKDQEVKCRYCGKVITKNVAVSERKGVYYCSHTCLNSAKQNRLNKTLKNFKSEKDTDRRLATDYIQQLYFDQGYDNESIPWIMIGSQMKNMLDENTDWNYATIYYVLWYMNEIAEVNVMNGSSPLNLVPYYYAESRDFFFQTNVIKDNTNNFELDTPTIIKAKRTEKKKKLEPIDF